MSSPRTSSKAVALSLLALTGLGVLTGCEGESKAAAPPAPIAGIVEPADLPGSPQQQPLGEDGIPLNGCTLGGSMSLQERADHKQFVQYSLDGGTVVKSFLYSYQNTRKLQQDWDFLVNGNKRCVGGMAPAPQGEYSLLKDLPTTATGYDTIFRSDTEVTHSQRVWARRGTGTIVSVLVTREVDGAGAEHSPSLPVDAKALALKVAAE